MARRLRAGLIGLGMMGRHHARVLRLLEGVDLVAVADPAGDPHGVAGDLPVLPDVAALVAEGLDTAMVAVPTIYHEEVALALAEAGVHTMVEKPIAESVASGTRVAEAFAARGLVSAVGHVERFNPALQELRRRLERGDLGEIYQITTSRQGPFPSRIADVGVVKDLATHDIDLTSWIANSPYAAVSARTAHRSGREHEDMVLVTGVLANGIVVNHVVNWLSPKKERQTIVTGARGAYVADTATGDLTFFENGTTPTQWDSVAAFRGVSEGDVTRFAISKREPLLVEQETFRDAVLGQQTDVVTMAEGLRTLAVAEAILRSAQTGETVALD